MSLKTIYVPHGCEHARFDRSFATGAMQRSPDPSPNMELVLSRTGLAKKRLSGVAWSVVLDLLWMLRRAMLLLLMVHEIVALWGLKRGARRVARCNHRNINPSAIINHKLAARSYLGNIHDISEGMRRPMLCGLALGSRSQRIFRLRATCNALASLAARPWQTTYNGITRPMASCLPATFAALIAMAGRLSIADSFSAQATADIPTVAAGTIAAPAGTPAAGNCGADSA